MRKWVTNLLWVFVLLNIATAAAKGAGLRALPSVVAQHILVYVPFAFALIHGSRRHGWRGIFVFAAVCLVVSNVFENMSVMTKFPFGNYYYTDLSGPKIFHVPLLIGPAYFGMAYSSWLLAQVLLRSPLAGRGVFLVPFVASFLMVCWDMCMDPYSSTVLRYWVWRDGGGYFGVPLSNFAGWFLTVFIIFRIFAIYVARRPERTRTGQDRAFWYQAALNYAGTAFLFVALAFFGADRRVVDPSGHAWSTGDIFGSIGLVAVFTMVFIAVLALIRISEDRIPS